MAKQQSPEDCVGGARTLLEALYEALSADGESCEQHARDCQLAIWQMERCEQLLLQRGSGGVEMPVVQISLGLAAKLLVVLCELSDGSSRPEEQLADLRMELSDAIPV